MNSRSIVRYYTYNATMNCPIEKINLNYCFQMPGLDPLMRSEIVSSVSTCASYSTCLADTADSPSSSSSVLLRGGAVAPLVMFVNCFKGKKMEAW